MGSVSVMLMPYGLYCFRTQSTMYGQLNDDSSGGMTASAWVRPSPAAITFAVLVAAFVAPLVMLYVPPLRLR